MSKLTKNQIKTLKKIYSEGELKSPIKPEKMYVVWNRDKTTCVGFDNSLDACTASEGFNYIGRMSTSSELARKCLNATENEKLDIEEYLVAPKDTHNTSCTYQFELAFLHLQDTPELRKMYWSALGQLQFDTNDQVIPPELEECPCCKQPIIRKIGTETEGYETYDIGVDESGNRYVRHPHCDWEPEE